MNKLSGYKLGPELYKGKNSLVHRAIRELDEQAVILKILNHVYPTPEQVARFTLEYEIVRDLTEPTDSAVANVDVVRTLDLTQIQDRWVMVFEDIGGESLSQALMGEPLPVDKFLPIGLRIADALGQIHQHQVVHKDINPSNIILNLETDELRIIDFGIATTLSHENPMVSDVNTLEGTLSYIAPEQTGRMNRSVDYRTDYYALGATYYYLLTGQLPFQTDDAAEMVHSHIARQPVAPHKIRQDLPATLSDIVMKLMAKNAEDRYQSTQGLKVDLQVCIEQWAFNGDIAPFVLGQQDISDRFQIPQKLYGRENEVAKLLSSFERASAGGCELTMVAGYTGIGKSALVQEIHKPIARQNGYFISGKFDQFQRDIPYASLIEAFRELTRQLLSEPEARVLAWRAELLTALGPNGQVLVNVIPEIELIIGAQPDVPQLLPIEAQNRFNYVLQSFIQVFTKAEHPLVIFLDDLQWADSPSLNVLELLMSAWESKYLLLIGTYRDNEVSEAHPLQLTLNAISKSDTVVNSISLTPLVQTHVVQLIADTVQSSTEEAASLATLVIEKTEGNPFFVNEFLKSLHAEELLNFDFQSCRWRWDLQQIRQRNITDNVAELMGNRVQQLAGDTQNALRLAACVGNQFDLRVLSVVCQQPMQETAEHLWEALDIGLILPTGDAYKLTGLDVQGLIDDVSVGYRFAHDQIQQAAYHLTPKDERAAVHWRIGRLLLEDTPTSEHDRDLFDIVNQLNAGRILAQTVAERHELAQLNLSAGQKAKSSAAYQPASTYLKTGLALLQGEDAEPTDTADLVWTQQYDLALDLHVAAAEIAYLNTDFSEMEKLVDTVLEKAKTLLDKIRIYEVQIQAYMAQYKWLEAVESGVSALKLLDIHFPAKPSQLHILLGLAQSKITLARKKVEDLDELPEMQDPLKLAGVRIMAAINAASYLVSPNLFPLLVFKQVDLMVKHGNAREAPLAYGVYGVILCGAVGDVYSGYKFGELSLRLLNKFNATQLRTRGDFTVFHFIRPWVESLESTLEPMLGVFQKALESGDLEFAGNAINVHTLASFYSGQPLRRFEEEASKYSAATSQIEQERAVHYQGLFRQAAQNLMGDGADDPRHLQGDLYDEEKMRPVHQEANDLNALFHLHTIKIILNYLFGDYTRAVELADEVDAYVDGVFGTIFVALPHFYGALARLAQYDDVPKSEQKRILKKGRASAKKLKKWMGSAPTNFAHKYYLVEAEIARTLGNVSLARENYDQAIALANENHYLNEEAIAYERAALFFFERNQARLAQHYLQDAYHIYRRWGASAKATELERQYTGLLIRLDSESAPSSLTATTTLTTNTSTNNTGDVLDLASVLKASQVISGEIVLDTLLARLMRIVIENAGAERGYLILEMPSEDDVAESRLAVQAEGHAARDEITTLQSIPVEDANLSNTIIQYVARTRENVVLNDAQNEGDFTQDQYVLSNQPASILCVPLINQGRLTGILYLENNLTTNAFTPDRIEVLNLLSSQAAVSIENATLYTQLEEYNHTLENRVVDRTRELSNTLDHLRETQDQLVEAEKMAALGSLVAGVAHEINTPVGIGVTAASSLEQRTRKMLDAYQNGQMKRSDLDKYLDRVRQTSGTLLTNLNRAAELIQSFKQVAVDRSTEKRRIFALKPYAEEVVKSLAPRLRPTSHTLTVTGNEELQINGDPGVVAQIVSNLVVNSLDHAFDEGAAGQMQIDIAGINIAEADDKVHLQYSDNGRGITEENLSQIFEPFFTTRRGEGGSGLGLHIIYNLVTQQLDGTIRCESEVSVGTKFIIELPMHMDGA